MPEQGDILLIPVPFTFTITSSDLARGGLNRPGRIRVDKIYTLSQSIVVRTFGRVDSTVLDRIRSTLQDLIAQQP